MSLDAAHEPAPLGGGYTTKIRICWPGYQPSEQQIQLRDQTPARDPISFDRFVRNLGNRVRQFLEDCEGVPISQLDPSSKWIVGHGGISANEVVLIGIVHVSAGSWMPILQLMTPGHHQRVQHGTEVVTYQSSYLSSYYA